ncbi:thiol-disulfide oxidoreductase DCC family protein [uncultured Lacinutrix sp.]|uniref:thiol-disulfide oxidoreductase DCC family protein n=1 Tax=uncultured Lacinutrix sp. TaxID=574032 RepID=UPI002618EA99|nr:DUF393 domain-containing protein [uncultured Lacinutrix sp.]
MKTNIVFFDGECAMCNGLVLFILEKDKSLKMNFISLQTKKAEDLLLKNDIVINNKKITTIYYLSNGKIKSHSDAIISIFYDLGSLWKVFITLKIIPKKIRDLVYRFISKNRYLFFGKQESCKLLSIENRNRIIE